MDIETSTAIVSAELYDEVETATTTVPVLVATPNALSNPNGMNRNEPKYYIARMQVIPFYPFNLNHRITPKHHLHEVPRLSLLPPFLSQSSSDGGSNGRKQQQQMNDEWKSIWQQIFDFMRQDTELQKIMNEDKMIYGTLVLSMLITLAIGLVFLDNLIYVIGVATVLIFCVLFAIPTYINYGDSSHRFGRITELPSTSYIMKLLPIVILLTITIFSLMEIDDTSDRISYGIFAMIPIFSIIYLLHVACYIPILISCRNRFYFNLERHQKALKRVYYHIKHIGDENVSYFTLRPKISFEDSKIVVDVYYKNTFNDDTNYGIEPSTSVSTLSLSNTLGMMQRRGGGDTGAGSCLKNDRVDDDSGNR